MEAKLVVNGVEVELNFSTLADISLSLSSSKANRKLFHELAKSDCADIREQVSTINSLDDETIDILINDTSIDVLRQMVDHGRAQCIIAQEDLERLIDTGDTELLCSIAKNVDEYDSCDIHLICLKLVKQRDPRVRDSLSDNEYAPRVFLETLLKDEDTEVANTAKYTLQSLKEWESDDSEEEEA
jgi:hypothetical protein